MNDPVKVELIADTERLIDMSDKDYHELARLTDFRLDKSTIVRYLEGEYIKQYTNRTSKCVLVYS